MSDTVRIIEMGPRDGLQNEKTPVGVEARIAFIDALVAAGLHTVEVGAFVSPKAIPQMVGSDQVLRGVNHSRANSTCWCRTKRDTRRHAPRVPR